MEWLNNFPKVTQLVNDKTKIRILADFIFLTITLSINPSFFPSIASFSL